MSRSSTPRSRPTTSSSAKMSRHCTTSYHPQANGLIKCYHTDNWSDALPIILLGLRTTFKPDIDASPSELVYGQSLSLPGEFLSTQVSAQINANLFRNSLCVRFILPSPTSSNYVTWAGRISRPPTKYLNVVSWGDCCDDPAQRPLCLAHGYSRSLSLKFNLTHIHFCQPFSLSSVGHFESASPIKSIINHIILYFP